MEDDSQPQREDNSQSQRDEDSRNLEEGRLQSMAFTLDIQGTTMSRFISRARVNVPFEFAMSLEKVIHI